MHYYCTTMYKTTTYSAILLLSLWSPWCASERAAPQRRTEVAATSESQECCRLSVYPEGKVWVSGGDSSSPGPAGRPASAASTTTPSAQNRQRGRPAPTANAAAINYTLYDPYGLVTKVWAYEVDPSTATVQTNKKLFEADVESLKCPKGYKTDNPEHKEMTKSQHSQTLCLHQNAQAAQKLNTDKWYAICRERTCMACHLDRMRDTQKYAEYVKVESAKIEGTALVVELKVLEPGMRYNVSMELGVSKDSLINATISPTQISTTIRIPNVSENVYRYPVYVYVRPWPKVTGAGCSIAARRQITILPPIKKVGALSRD